MLITCNRCGKRLPPGSAKYLIIIQATADFDGYLAIEDIKNSTESQIAALIKTLSGEPDGKAMQDIHEKKALILCPACKKAFMENPFNLPEKPGTQNRHLIQ